MHRSLVARWGLGRYDGGVLGPRSSPPRWLLAGAALAPLGPCAAGGLEETLRRIYDEHGLQDALPEGAPLASAGFIIPPHIVMWVLGGLVVGLLAIWLIREVRWGELRRGRGPRPPLGGARPSEPPPWFQEAEALAGAGRYGQAVHALLLGVLAVLGAKAHWSRAVTAREIAAEHARAGDLGPLVAAAERAHFGGEPATEREYRAARARAARLCDGLAGADSSAPLGPEPAR